jgi:hypothetical protein
MRKLAFLAALAATVACLGCEAQPEARPPLAAVAPAVPVGRIPPAPPGAAPSPDTAHSAAITVAPPAPIAGQPVQIIVKTATGVDPLLVGQVYGQAVESLGHCRQPGGGTVHVSVVKKGKNLQMHIEPGATLNPLAHECVLQALSTVEIPETGGNVGGPTAPPSGFTSLLTLSW